MSSSPLVHRQTYPTRKPPVRNRYQHCADRARQHYSLKISRADYNRILSIVSAQRKDHHHQSLSGGRSIHFIKYEGVLIPVIFHKAGNYLGTILSRDHDLVIKHRPPMI